MKTTKIFKTGRLLAVEALLISGFVLTGHAENVIISDFDDGIPDWDVVNDRNGNPVFTESGGTLSIRNVFPDTGGDPANAIAGVGWAHSQTVTDGQTLEYQVDVIQTSQGDVVAGIEYNCAEMGLYGLAVNQEGMWLDKVDYSSGLVFARFFHEQTALKMTNVSLSLALTGVGDVVRITAKLLDKDSDNAVLIERTVMDTPGVDPTVTTGPGSAVLQPDPGAPYVLGISAFLDLVQFSDGNQPEVEVIYDNFCWGSRSAAELTIERAVRLSWPAFSTPFVVEGAPAAAGPWTPVNEPVFRTNWMNWMTVLAPVSQTMQVFRLSEVTP